MARVELKLINRDTDYAVKALIFIAKKSPDLTSASELTERLGIPRPFLRKILQLLNKKGILSSSKGRGGGFHLALSPEQIALTNLIRIFQGPVKLNDCIFRRNVCPDIKTCALKKKIDALEDHFISELQSITIASLLENSSREAHK